MGIWKTGDDQPLWWWKPEKVEIRNGRIVPCQGSGPGIQCDPIKLHSKWRDADDETGEEKKPAYFELIEALDQADIYTSEMEQALKESEEGDSSAIDFFHRTGRFEPLLNWVEKHGFLGLLHHRVSSILHPPVWESIEIATNYGPSKIAYRHKTGPMVAVDSWSCSGWERFWVDVSRFYPDSMWEGEKESPEEWGRDHEGKRVPECEDKMEFSSGLIRASQNGELPGDLATGLVCQSNRHLDYHKTLHTYLVHRRISEERSDYMPPPMYSKEFALRYCEPLHEFIESAKKLKDAIEEATLPKQEPIETGDYEPPLSLNLFLDACRVSLLPTGNGEGEYRVKAPSLIGALAAMSALDISRGRLFRCDWCGVLTVSRSAKSKFCKKSHKTLASLDRSKKKKKARELAGNGLGPDEIAEELGIREQDLNKYLEPEGEM